MMVSTAELIMYIIAGTGFAFFYILFRSMIKSGHLSSESPIIFGLGEKYKTRRE